MGARACDVLRLRHDGYPGPPAATVTRARAAPARSRSSLPLVAPQGRLAGLRGQPPDAPGLERTAVGRGLPGAHVLRRAR